MQLYAKLFRAGNALQQLLPGGQAYWHQTQHMSTMAIAFHMNFNYVWLHLLKCALPGHAWCTILAKLANFSLVPIHWRTPYTVPWFSVVTFLCFSQQRGDGM
ncbi:Mpv17-like protein [Camelus dromedarius]|uniref:Mpv17-like protein n=1 Tax=Camelus dromedarius TaxID=9838 RepID=A0A5N4C3P1_CAMDR|nr:Mpv17-like protein [Camelus dromedarius]